MMILGKMKFIIQWYFIYGKCIYIFTLWSCSLIAVCDKQVYPLTTFRDIATFLHAVFAHERVTAIVYI